MPDNIDGIMKPNILNAGMLQGFVIWQTPDVSIEGWNVITVWYTETTRPISDKIPEIIIVGIFNLNNVIMNNSTIGYIQKR
ncbi:hypothetical protein AAC03nite_39490 [Alicyclobacillus acidoterrestris]|nr:hypothetical protein AAC03nite_39490 [Alicyclobacillus acidoterrestris]